MMGYNIEIFVIEFRLESYYKLSDIKNHIHNLVHNDK